MRSRVTDNCWPTSSSVWSMLMPITNRCFSQPKVQSRFAPRRSRRDRLSDLRIPDLRSGENVRGSSCQCARVPALHCLLVSPLGPNMVRWRLCFMALALATRLGPPTWRPLTCSSGKSPTIVCVRHRTRRSRRTKHAIDVGRNSLVETIRCRARRQRDKKRFLFSRNHA